MELVVSVPLDDTTVTVSGCFLATDTTVALTGSGAGAVVGFVGHPNIISRPPKSNSDAQVLHIRLALCLISTVWFVSYSNVPNFGHSDR